jgi:hypothetical protein
MAAAQDLFKLIAEAQRLLSALETAEGLDKTFKESVKAMLAGTGKPVTPDDAARFTELINDAKERQPDEAKALAALVLEIATILNAHFAD